MARRSKAIVGDPPDNEGATSVSATEKRVAIVTGSGQGIGQAFARRLAEDGRDLVLVDIASTDETADLVRKAGARVEQLACDVTDPEEVAALQMRVEIAFGRCDILVNNVGIYPLTPLADISFELWRKVHRVNLDSVFLMTQTFAPMMAERCWGRIVNVTSTVVGLVVTGFAHYVSSKAGVIGFTRASATELAPGGITVNAIAPSLTRTPTSVRRGAGAIGDSSDAEFQIIANMQAIKRVSEVSDLVGPLSFLTSDDSEFVTGQTVVADGGLLRV
jgi:NAD(P)-dependent dehydrogenase (short-subunit alcohol dehydrogenase family)